MNSKLTQKPLRVGVSSCLLGEKVRFDGGHKRNDFLTEVLSAFVEWVPVCPEFELGLGIPREALHLENCQGEIRLIQSKSGKDLSAAMKSYSRKRLIDLKKQNLDAYILKKNSPSCGMERVKIYSAGKQGVPARKGRGVFASALQETFPLLPMEEEGRLSDPVLRENFIERLFAYQSLKELFGSRWTLAGLIAFHARHKLALMAHSPLHYKSLGGCVGRAKKASRSTLEVEYSLQFMQALSVIATRSKHTNVLLHLLGFFKSLLDAESRRDLLNCIEDYRKGLIPLIVPITLIQYFSKCFKLDYLLSQSYLNPHPKEMMLRNHV